MIHIFKKIADSLRPSAKEDVREISAAEQAAIDVYGEILYKSQFINPPYMYKNLSDVVQLARVVVGYNDYLNFLNSIELSEEFSKLVLSKIVRNQYGSYVLPDLDVTLPESVVNDAGKIIREISQPVQNYKTLLLKRLSFLKECRRIPQVEINISDKEAEKMSSRIVSDINFSNITKKTRLDRVGNFVVFDVETSGLSVAKNEIVEISAIRFADFHPVEAFSTLCKPKKGIPAEATNVNGITEDMVEDKPTFGQIAESFLEFIGSDNLVGHNLEFDLKFIIKNGADVMSSNRKYYDTLDIAQKTLKKVKEKWDKELGCYVDDFDRDYDVLDYKLETLCEYYGIPLSGAHRALADCMATGMLFEQLCLERIDRP